MNEKKFPPRVWFKQEELDDLARGVYGCANPASRKDIDDKYEYLSITERDYEVLIARSDALEDAASLVDADDKYETENSRMLSERAATYRQQAEEMNG